LENGHPPEIVHSEISRSEIGHFENGRLENGRCTVYPKIMHNYAAKRGVLTPFYAA
jgi:hypothetical protein